MPTVSIIVPTRRRNDVLPRCLRSLYAQTHRDFEIVLVDDNPPGCRVANDPSLNGVLGDKRLRVVENPSPRNAAAARNCGLREARGEWITYLDDDDAYRPQKLQRQLQQVRERNVDLATCGLTYRLAARIRTCNTARTQFADDELFLEFPGMAPIFHRRVNVFFNEALPAVEDLYFYQELLVAFETNRVYNVPEALVERYLHRGPRVSLNAEAVWRGHLAVWRDFGSRYSPRARELFLLRSRLVHCNLGGGRWRELLEVCWQLGRLQGMKDGRSILAALLLQVPLFRPFIVS